LQQLRAHKFSLAIPQVKTITLARTSPALITEHTAWLAKYGPLIERLQAPGLWVYDEMRVGSRGMNGYTVWRATGEKVDLLVSERVQQAVLADMAGDSDDEGMEECEIDVAESEEESEIDVGPVGGGGRGALGRRRQ
jgi:hypothetical protein